MCKISEKLRDFLYENMFVDPSDNSLLRGVCIAGNNPITRELHTHSISQNPMFDVGPLKGVAVKDMKTDKEDMIYLLIVTFFVSHCIKSDKSWPFKNFYPVFETSHMEIPWSLNNYNTYRVPGMTNLKFIPKNKDISIKKISDIMYCKSTLERRIDE